MNLFERQKRCIINVATGGYVRGQQRLRNSPFAVDASVVMFKDVMPPGSPSHYDIPYAFKAWALRDAIECGHLLLLWADASIVPIASLDPLWDRIEREGYWIERNGWRNSEWTAISAYEALDITPGENACIPHVVATAFGINVSHPKGYRIFSEYLRLAQTNAFRGPWWNRNHPDNAHQKADPYRTGFCGDDTVRGHRHDQTALSVIAWRCGCILVDPPEIFAYRGGETADTILVADGNY